MEPPAITITAATWADVSQMDGTPPNPEPPEEGPEAAAVRFYGRLVAVIDEYGTADTIEGIDKEAIERLMEAATMVWPRRYMQNGVRVCHRCNYREDNHHRPGSPAPYTQGNCEEFVPVPEHLRF